MQMVVTRLSSESLRKCFVRNAINCYRQKKGPWDHVNQHLCIIYNQRERQRHRDRETEEETETERSKSQLHSQK